MKNVLLFILFIFGFGIHCVFAQTQGYWINPENSVPFLVEYDDTTLLSTGDSLIISFDGEPTFSPHPSIPDSLEWHIISDSIFTQLFGYEAINDTLDYGILFGQNAQVIAFNVWSTTPWDSVVTQSPWISTNRSLKMNSGKLSAAFAFNWYNMSIPTAKLILDPTVPVIEGDDLDYSTLPSNTTFVFDIEDFKTNVEEIDAVINHGVYTFNKPDFSDIYFPGFKDWILQSVYEPQFRPYSIDFNTYHDWLYEYLHGIALSKIAQISVQDLENQFQIIKQSTGVHKVFTEHQNVTYTIHSIDGRMIKHHLPLKDGTVNIINQPSGVYLLTLTTSDQQSVVYKIIN
ncbi:MAG: T9SS type A sorting domain-containing protein [Flavobacteriales bacterium]